MRASVGAQGGAGAAQVKSQQSEAGGMIFNGVLIVFIYVKL
jgi:hypothetical protein